MALLIISFIAGVLTVLAPCVLPVLPVIIGSSASGRSRSTPYIVVGSLAVSIILFTYLLKASTAFIMVPPQFWTYLSGGIILLFGLTLLFPSLWEKLPGLSRLSIGPNKLMGAGYQRKSFFGDVLIGAALGPVFSTCSPTYFVILASVLPASFALGTVYLLSYTLGLSLILLLIALLGQRFANRLSRISDPHSYLKRGIGIVFIILGILIASGYEKKLEVKILDSGFFDITRIEQYLLQRTEPKSKDVENESAIENSEIEETKSLSQSETGSPAESSEAETFPKPAPKVIQSANRYKEIVNPSGFVNTEKITLGNLIGKKVILVDFLTYSCINCQRTFPYLNAWYKKYKDQGLEIVGIHTPEFAFEKDINNVKKAMEQFGITHPIVLDNDYSTWNAYGNRFWPRKYLIDIHGNVVYDHIGEGAYAETEAKIQELLAKRAEALGAGISGSDKELASSEIPLSTSLAQSPETYFGSLRNEYLANGTPGQSGEKMFFLPQNFARNALYLGGLWKIYPEYAESASETSVVYKYKAKEVYIVADADTVVEAEVFQDNKLVGSSAGADVNSQGIVKIKESRLYKLILNPTPGEHTLELKIKGNGLRLYAFTFG